MNTEQAKEYAKTMTYREAVSNIKYAKGVKYRQATMIKLRELAEIADRLDRKTEPQIDCYMCKWLGEVNVCGRCRNRNLFAEANTKPQTIDLGNGFSITANDCDTCKYDISKDDYDLYDMCEPMAEGECKYEPKDKPQTVSLTSAHISGDIYHKVKDESQMERSK